MFITLVQLFHWDYLSPSVPVMNNSSLLTQELSNRQTRNQNTWNPTQLGTWLSLNILVVGNWLEPGERNRNWELMLKKKKAMQVWVSTTQATIQTEYKEKLLYHESGQTLKQASCRDGWCPMPVGVQDIFGNAFTNML